MIKQIGWTLLVMLGSFSWVIVLANRCLETGNGAFLGRFIFPVSVISLGLALTIILVAKTSPFPPDSASWMLGVYGTASLALGIEGFLLGHWLMPIINADAKLQDVASAMLGVGGTAANFCYIFLTAGVIMLCVVVSRLPAQKIQGGEGTTESCSVTTE